jgi:hypothetical protein
MCYFLKNGRDKKARKEKEEERNLGENRLIAF